MAWKGRNNIDRPPDFTELLVSLLNSKLQQQNFPLYQTIEGLIKKSQQNKTQVNQILQSFFGNITITDDVDLAAILAAISNINDILNFATFWTENDESVRLPASRQAIAGIGITLDYSVANQVTISATATGTGLVPMTTGAYPGAIMFIGQRVMMVYA